MEIVAIDEKGATNRLGTGFFISPDGRLVTNRHVIEGAASMAAINNNGAIFVFERVVAQPAGVDLAILKFRATDVPFITLGKSTTAVEGQKVIVIGNPTGLFGTVSDGIILRISRKPFINPDHRSYFAGIKRLVCHGRERGGHWRRY